MFFLSSILGAPIIDNALRKVGTLKDVIAEEVSHGYAPIRGILIRTARAHKDFIIPWQTLETYSPHAIHLTAQFDKIAPLPLAPHDVLLNKSVMDQQIIDTSGARVIRVNDLQLGVVEGKTCVIAIDISFKAILRRLKMDGLDVFNWLPITLIDWRPTKLVSGTIHLSSLSKDLDHLHPADVANVIEELNVQQGSEIIKSFDPAVASKVFQEMDPELRSIIVKSIGPERSALITDRMPVDEVVDLLKDLPAQVQEELLKRIQSHKAVSAGKLMKYHDNSAGGLLTTDFLKVGPDWTVEKTLEEIREKSPQFRSLHYIYVVDDNDTFLGVVSLRRLLLADTKAVIASIMRGKNELKTLRPHWRLNRIANLMTKYNLSSVSVVEKGKMLGVVTIDDVMRMLMPHA